jgi:hypothetical protein
LELFLIENLKRKGRRCQGYYNGINEINLYEEKIIFSYGELMIIDLY